VGSDVLLVFTFKPELPNVFVVVVENTLTETASTSTCKRLAFCELSPPICIWANPHHDPCSMTSTVSLGSSKDEVNCNLLDIVAFASL